MESEAIKERWENYRKANAEKPLVRNNELKEVFTLLNPQEGETILEVGTGNGYLTLPIAEAVGGGKIITADVSEDNLKSISKPNIETLLFTDEQMFPSISDNSIDAVATIATLHHFDNRKKGTGESGRIRAIKEFYRVLKEGGRLVMADVAHNTISQRYFDAIDIPEHCYPEGHPHDFFIVERLQEILKEIGFSDIQIDIKRVPWQFNSINEAKEFVHTIHNAKCSIEESFEVAEKYLGFNQADGKYELGWELYFVIAVKYLEE